MSDVTLEIAQKYTSSFNDNVMHEHHNAMQCMECEEMLGTGIRAYEWVGLAEKVLREADENGILDLTVEMEEVICQLWNRWLEPVAKAEELIQQTQRNGFEPDNLDEFLRIKECASETIDRMDLLNASRKRLFESADQEDE